MDRAQCNRREVDVWCRMAEKYSTRSVIIALVAMLREYRDRYGELDSRQKAARMEGGQ